MATVRFLLASLMAMLLASSGPAIAQTTEIVAQPAGYPQTFTSPIDGRIELAGSFAEMRPNHFHGGVDIKTDRRVGMPIRAIGPGYVSRIGVSPSGYGHLLYVAHPNGYTSVYAHLSAFADTLAEVARDEQYLRRSFRITLAPDSGAYPVRQGQVIGYSGNTGSSLAPHLHLEIRDTETGDALNPSLFGLGAFADTTPPRLYGLRIYARDAESQAVVTRTNGRRLVASVGRPVDIALVQRGGAYVLDGVRGIEAAGFVAFGLRMHDFHEGSSNRLGVFTSTLTVDGERLFAHRVERIRYGTTRYMNAHVDYGYWQDRKLWIQRSHRLPGNELDMYQARGDGWLRARPDSTYALAYLVEDADGNAARLAFEMDGARPDLSLAGVLDSLATRIDWQAGGVIEGDGFRAEIPERSLYDDASVRYEREARPSPRGAVVYSALHRLHTPQEPLHRGVNISIRPDSVGLGMHRRLFIAALTDDGKVRGMGGRYNHATGVVSTRARSFGAYFVTADTMPPSIATRDVADGVSLAGRSSITFTLGDDLSGVASYRGTIDGAFALFEYDPKTAKLTYRFDERVRSGPHVLRIEALDWAGNRATYRARFTR